MIRYCIPTYNSFHTCAQAVDAVMAGTLLPDELIIIDDSAENAALTVLMPTLIKYENSSTRIEVWVHEARCGVATSWNQFLAKSQPGDVTIIANDDVAVHPHTLKLMTEEATKSDDLFFAGDNAGNSFSLFLMKHECLEKIGGFDTQFWPAYFEDNDYSYRLRKAGYKLHFVPGVTYDHVGSSTLKNYSSADMQAHHQAFRDNQAYYVRKWGGMPGAELYTKEFNIP